MKFRQVFLILPFQRCLLHCWSFGANIKRITIRLSKSWNLCPWFLHSRRHWSGLHQKDKKSLSNRCKECSMAFNFKMDPGQQRCQKEPRWPWQSFHVTLFCPFFNENLRVYNLRFFQNFLGCLGIAFVFWYTSGTLVPFNWHKVWKMYVKGVISTWNNHLPTKALTLVIL